ncbi:MAG: S8 family serine peptidase [Phycisphaeraceae bacterium]|nr:S8 family serine peptidase [Phycisphaeraceae bacterium]
MSRTSLVARSALLLSALAGSAPGQTVWSADMKAVNLDWLSGKGWDGNGATIGIIEAGGSIKNGFDLTHPDLTHVATSHLYDFYDWRDGGAYHVKSGDNGADTPGTNDDSFAGTGHGTNVLSIINSRSTFHGGAEKANVFGAIGNTDEQLIEAMNWAVYQQGTRILNMSFRSPGTGDGSDNKSRVADYLAYRPGNSVPSVVAVVAAGNDGNAVIPGEPGDGYNVITVGGYDRANNQVWASSNGGRPGNSRSLVDVLAPSRNVDVAAANWEGANPDWIQDQGTSLATPMVTSAVAGLHEFADAKGMGQAGKDAWLMRAVLVNSARKDVKDSAGNYWKGTEAYATETIPLDNELGAGLLDARRALHQLEAGKQGPGMVEMNGWDNNLISVMGEGGRVKYEIKDEVKKDSQLRVTLAWNRYQTITDNISNSAIFDPFGEDLNGDGALDVALAEGATTDYNRDGDVLDIVSEDLDGDGALDGADTFNFQTLDNLDIFLYRVGDAAPVKRSISAVDSIEHIVFDVPADGKYRIEVQLTASVSSTAIYGLAWSVPAPGSAVLIAMGGLLAARRRRAA